MQVEYEEIISRFKDGKISSTKRIVETSIQNYIFKCFENDENNHTDREVSQLRASSLLKLLSNLMEHLIKKNLITAEEFEAIMPHNPISLIGFTDQDS
jgi:hypothetical protein